MEWVYDDGGRSEYFAAKRVGDCVCRAVAIATGKDYKEVYDDINELAKAERIGKRKKSKSSARNGVYKDTIRKLMEKYGWEWVPTMFIGSGCKTHLREDELPGGRLVVNVSRHSVAVIDGVIHDTYDPSRKGTRCVYGYFKKKAEAEPVPKKESKHERFLRVAEARTNRAANMLRLLGKCGNTRNYEYTDEEVKAIFSMLKKALREAEKRYEAA